MPVAVTMPGETKWGFDESTASKPGAAVHAIILLIRGSRRCALAGRAVLRLPVFVIWYQWLPANGNAWRSWRYAFSAETVE